MGQAADAVVQRLAAGGAGAAPALDDGAVRSTAAAGFAGPAVAVPHRDVVQRSFGRHDVSGVEAHVGGAAADASAALGARAYASGSQVSFAEEPDLFLAAHELAHVVQQRGGVQLASALGAAGDQHEQHADAVAAAVVRGESAEPLLDQYAGGGGAAVVQRDPAGPGDIGALAGLPVGAEGHLRVSHVSCMQGGRVPVGPYAFLTGVDVDGMLDYRIGPGAGAAGTGGSSSGEIHVGAGGAQGHGNGSAGIEAELVAHVAELVGGASLDVSAGADLSWHEGSVGVGISGGSMRFGSWAVPLPTVQLNLVQWERAEPGETQAPPSFLVGVITIPFPATRVLRIPVAGGAVAEVTPHIDVVLEIEANWPAIAAATGEQTAASAEAAAAAEAASVAESGVTAAEGAAFASEVTGAGVGAGGLAAGIGLPVAAGAVMLTCFALDVGHREDVAARARAAAVTLFEYCMTWTLSWLEPGSSPLHGVGAQRAAADAAAAIAQFRAAHPGADIREHARRHGARRIYEEVYDTLQPLALESLRAATGTEPGAFDDMVIVDQLRQVRWNGPRFRELGS
jgi:hypothetical protein